jgi:hypothetical protein
VGSVPLLICIIAGGQVEMDIDVDGDDVEGPC